ncbi:MAG: hypothetical protein KAV00_11940 [Phycisphaerae bacterium]|nr:hypothetical protein [Phycisphaerae bacterium]
MAQKQLTNLWISTPLLKRLETVVPGSLQGRRKHKIRVEFAIEEFTKNQNDKGHKLAQAG